MKDKVVILTAAGDRSDSGIEWYKKYLIQAGIDCETVIVERACRGLHDGKPTFVIDDEVAEIPESIWKKI